MKKVFLITLLIISAQVVNAQDSLGIVKNKFRVTQSFSFAILYGKDDDKDTDTPADEDELNDVADNIEDEIGSNLGINGEYSLTFIFGNNENGVFKDNPLGFALSPGIVFSVDNSGEYSTFDALLKFGIETGYGHSMGCGLDLLFGTGKSLGFIYFYEEGSNKLDDPIQYTEWCMKNGFQAWVRTGLLKQIVPNSTTSLFVRYVYSKEPAGMEDEDGVFFFWQEEAWQIGFLINFKF